MTMSRVAYQIRVAGVLPARFSDDFSRLTVVADPVGTTIRADLSDQAELNGILDALRRDGLVLLELRREQVLDADERDPPEDSTTGPL